MPRNKSRSVWLTRSSRPCMGRTARLTLASQKCAMGPHAWLLSVWGRGHGSAGSDLSQLSDQVGGGAVCVVAGARSASGISTAGTRSVARRPGATVPLFLRNEHCSSFSAVFARFFGLKLSSTEAAMNTTWNFILAGAVTLASAAGIVTGETAKGELRFVEAA